MSISDFLENELLDHVLRNSSYTPPATVYLSLHTADPGETGGSEVTGGSYARRSITFGAASGGQVATTALITFPTATADWGTITHLGIYDALTVGNLLWSGALSASKLVKNGDTPKVQTGALVVALD